jgi:hypothetical protein
MKTKPTKLTDVGRTLLVFLFIIIVLMGNWTALKNAKKKPVQLKINFDTPPELQENWDEFGLVSQLTLDQFRTYPGCEHYSNEEASQIIGSLRRLALIGFNSYASQTEQSIFIVDKY